MFEPEEWRVLLEFPYYEVSTYGNVRRVGSVVPLSTSFVDNRYLKVSIQDVHRKRCTKLIKRLVAETFIPQPFPNWDTVIVLDNDQLNMHVSNLMWRPRRYAWNYFKQFEIVIPETRAIGPVRNEMTGVEYENVAECSIAEGILFIDVQMSIVSNRKMWPTQCLYTTPESRAYYAKRGE